MIQSKQEYNYYLERDRVASGIPPMNSIKAKVRQFFFPSYEWQFIKALRWLEYCENVKKITWGWISWIIAKYRFRKIWKL